MGHSIVPQRLLGRVKVAGKQGISIIVALDGDAVQLRLQQMVVHQKPFYFPLIAFDMRLFTSFLLLMACLPFWGIGQDCSPSRSRCSRGGPFYLELGGSGHYWVARTDAAPAAFDRDQIGGQLHGMVGIRVDRDRRRANVLGLWGTMGLPNRNSLQRQLGLLGRNDLTTNDPLDNRYREFEVGLLLRERLRLSAGRGEQHLMSTDGTETILEYYTGTAGLNLRVGRSLTWNTAATVALGGNFDDPIWRLSTGLAYFFNG